MRKGSSCAPIGAQNVLPYKHTYDMVVRMKTTLIISDPVMAALKREAARQGRTMSAIVETALRLLFQTPKRKQKLRPLPTFSGGKELVDISDRNALYDAMERR